MQDSQPTLKHKQAFREALKAYQASERAKAVLADTPFVVLSGLAGGGRNTAIRRLMKTGPYMFLVSDTTRPPKFRDGRLEQDGVDYYFRNEVDMLEDIRQGEFIEAEIIHNQQVSGTSIREVERVIASGKIPIHDFEYGGANAVANAKPDADIIGLLPPDYDEWIRRLTAREEMYQQEFLNRLTTAKGVLENMLAKAYFKFVVNDNINSCVKAIRQIVEKRDYPKEMHEHGKTVAKAILERVNQTLQDSSNQGS